MRAMKRRRQREISLTELQEAIKKEVMKDLIIQDCKMSESDQKWWYKALTNFGKLLQAAWDKRRRP